ncbi:putative metalloprotease CJM1_0395 family protein [Pseudocolwellia sp. AS88]|uniref:putative metalloprotease CJM1_0395 family protein n=1 Tax=Pseudocolwellia sp. AS88 TaxID=3063958 RepID=UPI0026E99673|nr:putative metalloprotease CJM1_0395 family protein [Pseudocolwellia sp. AS88]MDO7084137.1 putative metalloprotease CJM1_0395 family protein [Pseudocolwellia sp. AS88]
MNITPHVNPLPVATAVNPPTDNLRQENASRPIITAPTQTNGSPAEKGTADKHKASDQSGDQFNFTELQKSAEKNANQIAERSGRGEQEHNQENNQESANQSSEEKPENSQESVEAVQNEKEIQQLKARDQEVRAHELAHASVGGSATGSPSYEFEIGPDGNKYAVAGEVSVDLSPVPDDPQATIAKMEQVYAAALAPADPSAQDLKVAAQAADLIAQAQVDLATVELDESEGNNQPQKASPYIGNSGVFRDEASSESQSRLFDTQISQTLKAQEEVAPSISNDVKARSERIEGYYSNIIQAYEKQPSHQFELSV